MVRICNHVLCTYASKYFTKSHRAIACNHCFWPRRRTKKSLFFFLEISGFCLLWSKNTTSSITRSEISNAVLYAGVIALVTVLNWLGCDIKTPVGRNCGFVPKNSSLILSYSTSSIRLHILRFAFLVVSRTCRIARGRLEIFK